MITNMTAHMEAFLMSHGGIDMEQFYEDYSDVTVDGIVEALTSKLIEALTEDDNQDKLKALAPKRQTKEKSDKIKDPNKPGAGEVGAVGRDGNGQGNGGGRGQAVGGVVEGLQGG